jgi:hypothetical protein
MQASGSRLGRFTPRGNPPGNCAAGSCVGSTAGLDVLKKEKPLSPTANLTPDRPARTPVTMPTTLHWLLDAKLIDMVKEEVENS